MHAGNLLGLKHAEFREMNSQRKEKILHREGDLGRVRFARSSSIGGG